VIPRPDLLFERELQNFGYRVIDKATLLIEFFCTGFYTRKVKYTQETFCEKFQAILDGFPRLQDIHPFRKFLSIVERLVVWGSNLQQTRI
jgi:GTP1/Obg family GTP-binding protein